MPEFTSSEANLGLVGLDTLKRFPAASFLLGRQAATDAGLDTTDPKQIATAVNSRTMADRVARAADAQQKKDSRTLNRLMNVQAPQLGFQPGQGSVVENMNVAADINENSLRNNIIGRGILGREQLRNAERLATLAEKDVEIDARDRKLKDATLKGLDSRILDTKSRALAGRAILRSQLTNLSPSQRNAVLAAQGRFFTQEINDLQDLRTAREGAIDRSTQESRDELEKQIRASEARVRGLESAISIMEENGADAGAIADIRVKLAQEMEKNRKKRGGGDVVTREDIILDSLVRSFRSSHANRQPNATEMKDLQRQADLIAKTPRFKNIVDTALPDNVAGPLAPGQIRSGDLGTSLEGAGFGIPISREESADLQIQERKRLDAQEPEGGGGLRSFFGF